jgi:PAS domain S-box-containing protein
MQHTDHTQLQARLDRLEQAVHSRTRELAASEERYRELIEDLPEIVFALDAAGCVIQLNRAGRSRLGIHEAELPGLRLNEVLPDLQRRKAATFFKRLARTRRTGKLEVLFRDRDGEEFPVQLLVKPVLQDGQILGYRGLARDIARQQARERHLTRYASRVEHREQQIQELISEAIYVTDHQGRFTFVNGRMAALLGVAAEQAPGRAFGDFLPLECALRLAEDFQQRMAGAAAQPFEISLPDTADKPRLLEVNTSILKEDDRPVGVVGVARDITSRRTLENQLAQATRLASLGQFASGIAHEINNPLGLVSGYAEELQCLLEELPGLTDSPESRLLRQGLATIQEQAYRCKYITDNLLAFARRNRICLEQTDLGELVRERLAFFVDSGMTRGIEVQLTITEPSPQVQTDPTLCGQVLLNLLKNACDALQGQGRIEVTLDYRDDRPVLTVADNGKGIPTKVMDKIFDPFFTTKAPGKGTGLGLSICYGIVSELRGRLDCGNRPEGGAWFAVSLPATQAETQAR